ncbi:HAMP domain-containing protein, partial [Candidatus Sumerlaeota bacterium]|nr:HAMP domain-containing protein [Candidatus Sumerlaeota bacterium]
MGKGEVRLRLRTKILLISIATLLLAVGATAFTSGTMFKKRYREALETNALAIGQHLASQLEKILKLRIPLEDLIGFEEQCRDIVTKYPRTEYAAVVRLDGKMLFHSDPAHQGLTVSAPDVLRAIESPGESVFATTVGGDLDYVATIPVLDSQRKHVASVMVAFSAHIISRETSKILAYSILAAGISALLALALTVFALSLWVTNPLTKLTAVIQDIREQGAVTAKVEVRSRDEIGDLADSFNKMTDRLSAVESEREKLLRDITEKNRELFLEIEERKQAQKELAHHRDHLEDLVRERTKELEETQRELLDAARQAGMAEIATDVLHNVGNVLNSVGVTAAFLREKIRRLRLDGLSRLVNLLESRKDDLGTFVTQNEQGKRLPAFLSGLSEYLEDERREIATQVDQLTDHVGHISEIVSVQQSYSRAGGVTERVTLDEIIDSAVKINQSGLLRHRVRLTVEPSGLAPALLDRQKTLQILVNLIGNAKYAVSAVDRDDKEVLVRILKPDNGHVRIEVSDNGVG